MTLEVVSHTEHLDHTRIEKSTLNLFQVIDVKNINTYIL